MLKWYSLSISLLLLLPSFDDMGADKYSANVTLHFVLFEVIELVFNGSDSNIDKRSWNEKLGKCDFTLAFILSLNFQSSSGEWSHHSLKCLPNPQEVISSVREFTSWIIWGKTGEESFAFMRHATELAMILLRHGQHDSVEVISVPNDNFFIFHILGEFYWERFLYLSWSTFSLLWKQIHEGRKYLEVFKILVVIGAYFNICWDVAFLLKHNVNHMECWKRGKSVKLFAVSSGT